MYVCVYAKGKEKKQQKDREEKDRQDNKIHLAINCLDKYSQNSFQFSHCSLSQFEKERSS